MTDKTIYATITIQVKIPFPDQVMRHYDKLPEHLKEDYQDPTVADMIDLLIFHKVSGGEAEYMAWGMQDWYSNAEEVEYQH